VRPSGVGAREPVAQHADHEQVEQPVEHRLLPGLVADDLGGEERHHGAVPLALVHDEQRGQGAQEAPADLAVELVGADKHHCGPIRGVAPRADAQAPAVLEQRPVDQAPADLAGQDRDLGLCRGIVRHRVGVRAAHQRDVAVAKEHRVALVGQHPGLAADHRDDRQRRLVDDPQRPRRIHARAQQERLPGARAVEEAGYRVHRRILDDRV
jgi:hypothetical protein